MERGLWGILRARRQNLDRSLGERGLAHTVSLPPFLLRRELLTLLPSLPPGRLLDAGSGRSPYLETLRSRGFEVVSLDIEDRSGAVDVVADVQNMPQVESASFDSVLSTQVLEHLPCPDRALCEIFRVLKPGGRLLLTAPHLSPIHEAPLDFFRYTPFGLRELAERAGFLVEEIRPVGGMIAFLGHLGSVALLTTVGSVPGLGGLVWALNYLLLVRILAGFDRALGARSVLPCNLLLLARRPV